MLRRDKKNPRRKFLLVIRQYRQGPTSFPKGHVEAEETEHQTAEREVFEETAVRIRISHDFRETIRYSPTKGVEKDVVYFVAYTEDRDLRPRRGEIAEAFWVDTAIASSVLDHDNDRHVFEKAMEYIENEEKSLAL